MGQASTWDALVKYLPDIARQAADDGAVSEARAMLHRDLPAISDEMIDTLGGPLRTMGLLTLVLRASKNQGVFGHRLRVAREDLGMTLTAKEESWALLTLVRIVMATKDGER